MQGMTAGEEGSRHRVCISAITEGVLFLLTETEEISRDEINDGRFLRKVYADRRQECRIYFADYR